MISPTEVQYELAQARQARIEAQLAGCEVEELADILRQSQPLWRHPDPVRRRLGPLFVFSS